MSQVSNSSKRLWIIALCLGLLVLALGVMSSAAAPGPVDIDGTVNVTGNQFGALRYTGDPAPIGYSSLYEKGSPQIVCKPDDIPTEFTGTLDVSSMPNGSVAFIGLLDRGLMAMNNKGYMSGAYLYVYKLNATTVRVGPSDGNLSGEIIQTFDNITIPGDNILDVKITIDGAAAPNTCNSGPVGNGVGCIYTEVEGHSRSDSYGNVKSLNNSTLYAHDEFSGGAYPGWDDMLNSKIVYDLTVDGCEAIPPAEIILDAPTDLVCGAPTEMTIDFSNVTDLYGYEFQVTYDSTKVNATGSFDNGWFDTTSGIVVPGWAATCTAGTCKFAVSLQNPAPAVSTTPAKTVAKIAFSPVAAGSFTAAVTGATLSDLDGQAMQISLDSADFDFDVCGNASISGKVSLQGRGTPMNAGFIKLIDTSNTFPDINATFDANGNYSVPTIPVMAGGTPYKIQATHYLYLGNEKALTLNPGDALTSQNTRLLGGDADNSGLTLPLTPPPPPAVGIDLGVDISDIGCIGFDFGTLNTNACGAAPNSTDINNDGKVNIQDLSIAGGNYDKHPFQPW